MADPINTGPNGFEIDGNQELFDTGLPEPADLNSPYGPRAPGVDVSAGYQDANGNPKDLTKVTKTTLSQYMSNVTKGTEGSAKVPNEYPVDPGFNSLTITAPDGTPGLQSPGAAPPSNTVAFAPKNPSSLTDNYTTISTTFHKGKASKPGLDGHDLLPGIPGNSSYVANDADLGKNQVGATSQTAAPISGHIDSSYVVKPYVSSVLAQNRFSVAGTNAGQQAFTDASSGAAGFNPGLTQQTQLGAYNAKGSTVTPGRLAAIGSLLTMRASGELGSTSPGANPNSGAVEASAILPGLPQLGVTQVKTAMLLASDVLQSLTTDELDSSSVLSIGDESWGQLNNTDDPFSGTDALGMLALSTALVAGVELVFDGLDLLIGLITPQVKAPTHDSQGRYSLGEYFAGTKSGNQQSAGGIGGAISALSSLNFGALLGIQPTNFPFSQALSVGTNAFFQVPQGAGILGQLAGAVSSSTDSPGFNVVVARSIIRSSTTIINQLKKIGGNVMNAINQTLSLIDVIRSSKLISALNVFATLGDAILSIPSDYIDTAATGGVKISQLDQLDDALASSVGKSRVGKSLKLAWASNRAPANLLLPSAIIAAGVELTGLGQFDVGLGGKQDALSNVTSKVTTAGNLGRIDPDDAADFEAALDAEYVPFYFHDVRTNEMVAFHAFLASLSDDYQASYERSEALGRVEPVKIYKGTERRINLSFYIAATSLNDFDEMWLKINKLTTLVYPQYTKGTSLSSADGSSYKFTQPFSQLVGASPLIRIRLGDLFKTNYSRFGLARLFGLGNPEFTINKEQFTDQDSYDSFAVQSLQAAALVATGKTFHVAPGNYPTAPPGGGALGGLVSAVTAAVPGLGGGGPQQAATFQPQISSISNLFIVTVNSIDADGNASCTVKINDDTQWIAAFSAAASAADGEYNNPDKPLQKLVGGTYLIPRQSLTPTNETKQQFMRDAAGVSDSAGADFSTALQAFLDPSKNAVAKSFKDTGGKGLAGFIESMSFDWFDKVTWETDFNRRAPKFCKVTIGFSPIHDISPGLDHMGFNRAPLYPVGLLAQQLDSPNGETGDN